MGTLLWKDDWDVARRNLAAWWERKGLALCMVCPRQQRLDVPPPPSLEGVSFEARWTDPEIRLGRAEHDLAGKRYIAEAFPFFDSQIGPGSLSTFLGAEPGFAEHTVWYEPCLTDADVEADRPLRLGESSRRWLDVHLRLVDEAVRRSQGRYVVGMPDLIENIDTLAALRGTEALLADLVERPAWAEKRIGEINEAFFQAFDLFYDRIKDERGGNAFCCFRLWGPGKTAKVQADLSLMISPAMFRQFVVPALREQCRWLDYSMYHLDGEGALVHLDALLEIDELDAIEWTPQGGYGDNPLSPKGGSPHWYDLYRRIRAAGKAVQVIQVSHEQVLPLIDAVGPEGLFIMTGAPDERTAETIVRQCEQFR